MWTITEQIHFYFEKIMHDNAFDCFYSFYFIEK